MKNIFAIILFFVVSLSAFAQTPTPTPMPVESTTAEEIRSARELLQKVVDKEQGQNITFADILDKGIDLVASYATSLGTVVKSVAPKVWEAMVWQKIWGSLLVSYSISSNCAYVCNEKICTW